MKQHAILIAIGIGAFLGVVLVCGGLGGGFLWLVKLEMDREWDAIGEVAHVEYLLTGPETVAVGEPARFVLAVTNTSDTEQCTIESLGLYTELVNQDDVRFSPQPRSRDLIPDGDYGEAKYDLPLPPGGTQRFEVIFTPTQAGYYNVNIDVRVGDGGFIEQFHDLRVQPASRDDAATR